MSTSRKTVIGGVVGVIVAIGLIVAGAYAFGAFNTNTNNSTSSINTITSEQSISTSSGGISSGISTSTSSGGSGSGSSGSGSTGTLQISMIDPPHVPANVIDVYINFSSIEVHIENGTTDSGWYNVTNSGTLNLTSIITSSQVLGSAKLPNGTYNIIRFNVTSSIVTVNDSGTITNYTASVPASMVQTVITGGVHVQPNNITAVLVDISPTVTGANGSYTLIPSATAHPQVPVGTGPSVTTNVAQSNHTVSVNTKSHTSASPT